MKKIALLALIVLTVSTTAKGQCTPGAANIFAYTFNGHNYEIIKEKLSWADAAACAVSRGGKLAEINSVAEQDSLFFHVGHAGITAANTVAPDGGGASYIWIGGNDMLVEGKWVWNGDNDSSSTQFWQGTSTGTAIGGLYSNWGNEPDNWTSQNGLGLAITDWPLGVAGQWNDVKEANLLYYVIEYPSPASVPALAQTDVLVYPNPVGNELRITFGGLPNASYKVKLLDIAGRTIIQTVTDQDKMFINVSDIAGKLLFLYITDASGNMVCAQKIIKQ